MPQLNVRLPLVCHQLTRPTRCHSVSASDQSGHRSPGVTLFRSAAPNLFTTLYSFPRVDYRSSPPTWDTSAVLTQGRQNRLTDESASSSTWMLTDGSSRISLCSVADRSPRGRGESSEFYSHPFLGVNAGGGRP